MLLYLLYVIVWHLQLTQSVGGPFQFESQVHCSRSQFGTEEPRARFVAPFRAQLSEDCNALLENFEKSQRRHVFSPNRREPLFFSFITNSCKFIVSVRPVGLPDRPWGLLLRPVFDENFTECVRNQRGYGGSTTGQAAWDGGHMKFKGILSTAPTTYTDNDDDKSAALLGGLLGPG